MNFWNSNEDVLRAALDRLWVRLSHGEDRESYEIARDALAQTTTLSADIWSGVRKLAFVFVGVLIGVGISFGW